MKGFHGFPPGKAWFVTLPEGVFDELLPLIDDLNELKVTLHCYWRLSRDKGSIRFVQRQDLLEDEALLAGLERDATQSPVKALDSALERAIVRGTLLHVRVDDETAGKSKLCQDWYFANTPKGRAAVQAIGRGEWPDEAPVPTHVEVTRPNIFVLYEQNVGLLQPLIADELRQAEQDYPQEWIEEAFRLAAEANVRRWSYVRAILQRWATEGKGDEAHRRDSESDRRRYIEGKYADYIQY
jgi:DnaD/phage-associated family protein